MEDILLNFHAMCNLRTRYTEATINLPPSLRPAQHLEITDVHFFTSTALTRLESDSARLRGISERSLRALINSLKS